MRRRTNPIDLEDVPRILHGELQESLARAVRAGAASDADYVGAGMTSIVFLSRGRAWKVARPGAGRGDFRAEADYLSAANALRLSAGRAARLYAFHEGPIVIEREYVEGRNAPEDRAWALRQELAIALYKNWGVPEFKRDSYILSPKNEVILVDAGVLRRGENLADYILGVVDGTYKDTTDRMWAWELRQDVEGGRLSRERAEEVLDAMADHWDLKNSVAEQRGLFKKNPSRRHQKNPYSPTVLDILERRFPLDLGFWSFEVAKHAADDQDFGYLAPPGVEIKALPGETVVEIPDRPPIEDEEEAVRPDFSGAKAVFTTKPIPADKIIEFGLYPDYHALPHYLLEIVGNADAIELANWGGNEERVALIHRDTYPEHERKHKGKVMDYRISFFDKYGPSGHRNGTLLELVRDALSGGYRILSPGALDRAVRPSC